MRYLLPLLLLCFLPACSLYETYKKGKEALEKVEIDPVATQQKLDAIQDGLGSVSEALAKAGVASETITKLVTSITDLTTGVKQALVKADSNQDGKVSGFNELWLLVLGLGQAVQVFFQGKQKKEIDELWTATHKPINA